MSVLLGTDFGCQVHNTIVILMNQTAKLASMLTNNPNKTYVRETFVIYTVPKTTGRELVLANK